MKDKNIDNTCKNIKDSKKLRFYSNISQEFRTPLTLINRTLESLIKGDCKPENLQLYYQAMLKNVYKLKGVIDKLLVIRKLEEDCIEMAWKDGDIIDFIKSSISTFKSHADKRNISFTFNSSSAQLFTSFDPDKLDKILSNLLSNAFKYTPGNGHISLKIEEKNSTEIPYQGLTSKYLVIKISDTGVGISKKYLTSIFSPFQQIEKVKSIGSMSAGIGLTLTKKLVQLHKGFITVESIINKGSIFTVYLPVFKNNPEEEMEDDNNFNDRLGLKNKLKIEPAENNSNAGIETHNKKPVLLIVDNNRDLLDFMGEELQDDYRVLKSTDVKDGYKAAINEIPDLIVSDVFLGKLEGIELCEKLKDDKRTSHIPVIIITTRNSEDLIKKFYKIGVDDYITKPFSISLMEARIKNLIDQRSQLRKLFGNGNNVYHTGIETNNIDSQLIEKLNTIIENNIDNPDFTPSTLASDMCMSKMQLYRKVHALTGQTVYNYIRSLRMKKAANLLLTTDMQIAEVAFFVGYTEPSNFTKSFIKHFDQTPSRFVKLYKGNELHG